MTLRAHLLLWLGLPLLAQEVPQKLPTPQPSPASLYESLKARKTQRNLEGPALSIAELAQLLWAAQGENRPGKRTVPSANARYPLELYVLVEGSPAMASGCYQYQPKEHTLRKLGAEGPSTLLGRVKGIQAWLPKSPAVFCLVGVPGRMAGKDPAKQEAYTYWEAGAATQGLLLQATALGLGSGVASGVDFDALKAVLSLPADQKPINLIAVGRVK